MGFTRFHRRIEIIPGVHLNIGKTGISISAGVPGAEVTLGRTGLRTTVGVPGTGASYTEVFKPKAKVEEESPTPAAEPVQANDEVPNWYVWDG